MILDYPPIYKGELLSSYVYRYHYYSGDINFSDTAFEIWGNRNKWISSIIFPASASSIIEQFGISKEQYIRDHTVLQFYKAFLQPKGCKKIEYEMLYGSTVHLKALQKNIAIDYDNLSFHYCPVCIKENNNLLIIRREHQIAGVYVCASHGCYLEKYIIRNRRDRIRFDKYDFVKCANFKNNKILLDISKDVSYILNHDLQIGFCDIINILYEKLKLEGILRNNGRVNISRDIIFRQNFREIPEEYKDIIRYISFEHMVQVNNYSFIKPLVYILVINQLYGSFENFYNEAIAIKKSEKE